MSKSFGYLSSFGRVKFLSAVEEADLLVRAKGGDIGARNALVESVLPWVIVLLERFVRGRFLRGVEFDDLLSVGVEAVILAVDGGFDSSKGRLTTYVSRKVFWAFDRFCKENGSVVRVPAYLATSLDRVRGSDLVGGGEDVYLDSLVDNAEHGDWEEFGESLFVDFHAAVGELGGDMGLVVRRRLGGATLQSIADEMGLSKERIRQLQEAGIKELRRKLVG